MNHFIVRLTVGALFGHCLISWAQAQLVGVGPGYVRAPFIRVYSYPDGSSYVRAPFVSIFTPGYIPGRFTDTYSRPGKAELARMDWRTLRQAIRRSSADLDSQLDTIATGRSWKLRLKTAEIRELAPDAESPPAPDVFQALQDIRQVFEATTNTPAFRMISSFDSFQALDDALREFLTPPQQRLRRQLSVDDDELSRSLDRIGAEANWHQYLALPPDVAASQAADAPGSPQTSAAELLTVLQRFDFVIRDDKYRAIAGLPAFKATRKHLADYLALLNAPAGRQPPIEELPAPRPIE